MKSAESSASHRAVWMLSSRSMPFALPESSGDKRTPTVNEGPTRARTSRITARTNRARFGSEPPHASRRWFSVALKNWVSR